MEAKGRERGGGEQNMEKHITEKKKEEKEKKAYICGRFFFLLVFMNPQFRPNPSLYILDRDVVMVYVGLCVYRRVSSVYILRTVYVR